METAQHTVYEWDNVRRRSRPWTFDGRLLVEATSHVWDHNWAAHDPEGYAPAGVPGVRCSACRWTDMAIYRTSSVTSSTAGHGGGAGGQTLTTVPMWVVYQVGRTIVPKETDRFKLRRVYEPGHVIAALLVKDRDSDELLVPPFALNALRDAAHADPDLTPALDTYLDRV